MAEGSYAINGQLTGNAGELLATAQAQFVVKEDSARVLSGSVTAQFASVLNGETQTCLDTAINSGNRDWDALELRRSVFRLDQESAGVQEPLTMSLAAGASQTLPRSFGTESLVPGNYACALEAFADGDWKPLGHANFTVIQEPPNLSLSAAVDKPAYDSTDTASIAASLRNNARYRIEKAVILQLQVRSPAGVAVYARDLALGNLEPGSTAPSSAAYSFAEAAEGLYAVQAYALNAAGDLLASAETQYEVRASAARAISGALTVKYASIQQTEPQTCTDTLRNSSHYAIPNLKLRQRLIRADSGVVVSASAPITLSVPGLGQQILTRVFATDPLTADTEYVCALDAFINENWKELASVSFTVLPPPIRLSAELTMGSKGRLLVLMDAAATGQTSNEPAPSAQRAALEALLKFEGWSYAITTDAAGFAHELRSGQYGVYALFSEIIKLDGTVQKELREAVYRGEGLLEAGSHDQRNSGFDEALGVKYKGKANGVTGAEYGASAVFSSGYADLVLRDKAIRSDIAGAEKHARYLGGNNTGGNDAAVTTHDYGRGRSVYIGYDLLAEFAQAGSASLHADVIKKALLHLQPVISGSLAGQTVPLVLKVSNLGVATPGRAQLSLPTGAVVKDGGSASLENGQAVWTFHLSSGEDKTITVWAQTPVNPGEAVFHANIQSGTAPGFTNRASASLTLNLQVSPSLDAARTLVASGTAYKKVQNWLDKAQSSITAQRYPQAQTELVNAADEAAKLSGAQAQNLRLMIDQALLENGRRL